MNETKLQLEAGKFYRTRDGRKAYVCGSSPFADTTDIRQCVGYIEGGETEKTWGPDGRWLNSISDEQDLVAEWAEPRRIKGWVNIYLKDVGKGTKPRDSDCGDFAFGPYHYATREHADRLASDRIACIEIDVLEGQGLEGEEGR